MPDGSGCSSLHISRCAFVNVDSRRSWHIVGVVLLVLDMLASLLMLVGYFLRFRRKNPTDLLALLMIFWMCVSQESALVISIPRYGLWLTTSSTCPSMYYG